MKICISTDLEGITGIDTIEMIQPEDPLYGYSVERLAADINAAVDGAFAGGPHMLLFSITMGQGKT
jgi:D-amino peptidase